ncbi:SDR family oxidoreductase [Salibacterium salarium]|uniref:SDR family oxidoreductase n=1 Tax=Salibacterium salarium TaxID=284579 RepID=A0A3R9QSG5_9BACI|nr:SDR family NAD(P)-dependent oxidoreductase [Salibacterium salarium]RSL32380.1 SDR family oxidoreductase [Salibacterium salarium]
MPCAIVTGSNGGFGQVIVEQLLEMEYEVIAGVRNIERANVLVDKSEKLGKREWLHVFELDVTDSQHIEGLKDYIQSKEKTVDVLINNAGYCQGGIVETLSEEEWRNQFDVNFFGTVSLTTALLPIFRRQRYGSIINMSSVSGNIGLPGMSAYAGSKFALEGFSESLRYEMLPFQVYVSLIEPSSYKTGIWEKALQHIKQTSTDYERLVENLKKEARQSAADSGDPHEVTVLLKTILQAKTPKLRYPLGKTAKQIHRWKHLLPNRWLDKKIIKRVNR